MRKKLILTLSLLLIAWAKSYSQPDFDWMKDVGAHSYPAKTKVYNATDYGADGDAVMLCTNAIQRAIDECSRNGGGIVTFSPGIYLTGSVFIKSNVNFNIPKGTTLLGSQNIDDYERINTRVAGIEMKWPAALINIVGQQNVAISGEGIIHGKGKVFWDKYRDMRKEYEPKGLRWIVDYDCERPRGVLISDSKDITVKDIVLYQPGFWSLHILYSEQITVDNIIISNNIEGRGPSTDGIDIDSSRKILIENCNVNCNDDNFCLKAGRDADGLRVNRPTEYVVIRNCIAGHGDGLFTCGSETSGSIRNIVAYNLKGIGTKYGLRFKSTVQRGGTVENIYLCNIDMQGVKNPFVVDLNWLPSYNANRLPKEYDYDTVPVHWKKLLTPVAEQHGTPYFRNIYFENINAGDAETCIKAIGMETSLLTHFCFTNVNFEGEKAGTIRFAEKWQTKGLSVKAKDRELKTENVKDIQAFK